MRERKYEGRATPKDAISDEDALKACALRTWGWPYAEIATYMLLESQAVAFELVRRVLCQRRQPTSNDPENSCALRGCPRPGV